MIDTINPVKPSATLIGIIIVFTIAGACAGFAAGLLATGWQAAREVAGIRNVYVEANSLRSDALRMCLQLATKSADPAAADAAKKALGQQSAPMSTPR